MTSLFRIVRPALVAALVVSFAPALRAADAPETPSERVRQIKAMQRDLLMSGPMRHVRRARATRFAPPDYRTKPQRDRRTHDRPPGVGLRQKLAPGADARDRRPGFGTPEAAGIPGGRRLLTDPNVFVNNPALDVGTITQSEPSVAAWRQYVVAAWNDGASGAGQGYAVSSDSGATFTDLGTPPAPSGGSWSSDPVMTVNGTTGEFYYCALLDLSLSQSGVGVVRGTFTGPTFNWDTPHVVASTPSFAGLLDKCWLAADPTSGNLYVVYSEFLFSPQGNFITFHRSTNNGVTWSPALRLSSTAVSGLVQGARPAVGPTGRLYVVWKEIGPVDQDFFRIRVSTDGGVSFGTEGTVANHYDNFGTGAPGFNRDRGITFPAIAVDHSNGPRRGRVYVAWNEATNWYDSINALGTTGTVTETENNNTAANANAFTPGQALSGGFTIGDADYYTFNAAQGLTYVFWCDQVPAAIYRMAILCDDASTRLATTGDTDDPPGNQSLLAWTAPSTGTYYLRMNHFSDGTGPYRVLTGIDPPGSGRGRDHRDIFVASSPDGGAWSAPVRVNDDPPYFDDWLPEVAVDGAGLVYTLWYDWRDSPVSTCGGVSHAYLSRSDDGGTTWSSLGPASDTQTAWSSVGSNLIPNQGDYLGLAATDAGVFPVWADGRLGNPDVVTAPLRLSQTQIVVKSVVADTGSARVTWRATKQGSPASVTVGVYRRFGATPFDSVGTISSDLTGALVYVDTTVTAEVTYQFRLRLPEGATSRFVGQVAVFVPKPVGPTLSMGAPYPNPTPNNVVVPITLPSGAPAKLALFDLAGREVRSQEVGWRGPGNHVVNLAEGDRLRPGIYLIRLTQNGQVATRRVSVVP